MHISKSIQTPAGKRLLLYSTVYSHSTNLSCSQSDSQGVTQFIYMCFDKLSAYIWAFSQPPSWPNLLWRVHMQWLPPLYQMHQIPESSLKERRETQNCYSPSCFPPMSWPRASVPRTTPVLAPGLRRHQDTQDPVKGGLLKTTPRICQQYCVCSEGVGFLHYGVVKLVSQ